MPRRIGVRIGAGVPAEDGSLVLPRNQEVSDETVRRLAHDHRLNPHFQQLSRDRVGNRAPQGILVSHQREAQLYVVPMPHGLARRQLPAAGVQQVACQAKIQIPLVHVGVSPGTGRDGSFRPQAAARQQLADYPVEVNGARDRLAYEAIVERCLTIVQVEARVGAPAQGVLLHAFHFAEGQKVLRVDREVHEQAVDLGPHDARSSRGNGGEEPYFDLLDLRPAQVVRLVRHQQGTDTVHERQAVGPGADGRKVERIVEHVRRCYRLQDVPGQDTGRRVGQERCERLR